MKAIFRFPSGLLNSYIVGRSGGAACLLCSSTMGHRVQSALLNPSRSVHNLSSQTSLTARGSLVIDKITWNFVRLYRTALSSEL